MFYKLKLPALVVAGSLTVRAYQNWKTRLITLNVECGMNVSFLNMISTLLLNRPLRCHHPLPPAPPSSVSHSPDERVRKCSTAFFFYICTRIAQPITWAQSDRYTKSFPSQPVHVQWVMVVKKKKTGRCAIGWENLERPATVPNWWKLWHKEVATFTEGGKRKNMRTVMHYYCIYT